MAKNYKKCIDKALKASAGHLTKEELLEFKKKMYNDIAKFKADQKLGALDRKIDEILLEKVDKEVKQRALDELDKVRSKIVDSERYAYLSAKLDAHKGDKFAYFRDTLANTAFLNESVRNFYNNQLLRRLDKSGLYEDFAVLFERDEKFQKKVNAEKWELEKGREGRVGITGDTKAGKMARILFDSERERIARKQLAGGKIRLLSEYGARQNHDMARVRAAGFDSFRDMALKSWDFEKTMVDTPLTKENIEAWIKEEYGRIIHDVHTNEMDIPTLISKVRKNQKKGQRKIFFKDADSQFEWNKLYGAHSYKDNLLSAITRDSREIALLETFGTNPHATYERLKNKVDLSKLERDPTKWEKVKNQVVELDHMFMELDGSISAVQSPTIASIGAASRALQNVTHLSLVTLSSLPDPATVASSLMVFGRDFVDTLGDMTKSLLSGFGNFDFRGKKYRLGFKQTHFQFLKDVAENWGVYSDVFMGSMFAESFHHGAPIGRMAKAQEMFFRVIGMNWWNARFKMAATAGLSNELGQNASRTFSHLSEYMRHNLERYNIDSDMWEMVRKYVKKDSEGRPHILYESIEAITDDDLIQYAKKRDLPTTIKGISTLRQDVRNTFAILFTDRANRAVVTPSAKQMAMLRRGTLPGTILGEALRVFAQFKGFGAAILERGFGELWYAAPDGRKMGSIAHMMGLAAAMTALGYISNSMKRIANGKTPITDPSQAFMAGFAQGGAGTIYLETLMNAVGAEARYNRSPFEAFLGPTAGDVAELAGIAGQAAFGKWDNVQYKGAKFIGNNLPYPFRNVANYLLLNDLKEIAKPGYKRRVKKRLKEEGSKQFVPMSAKFF